MKYDGESRETHRGEAVWLANGNILAPVAVEATVNGETIYADGRVEVERGSDLWEQWRPFVAGDPPEKTEAMKGVDDA